MGAPARQMCADLSLKSLFLTFFWKFSFLASKYSNSEMFQNIIILNFGEGELDSEKVCVCVCSKKLSYFPSLLFSDFLHEVKF